MLGSETASTVSSRGVYKFPVVPDDNSRFASWAPGYDPKALEKADGQCSSYDLEYSPWSNLPDDDWVWQDDKDWVIGEFVWTGYDYLGEPVIICIGAIGIRKHILSISCPTGVGDSQRRTRETASER